MSNRRRASKPTGLLAELSPVERHLHRTIRCRECGGRMGAPFRRPDRVIDAVVEHRPGCKTINVVFTEPKESA